MQYIQTVQNQHQYTKIDLLWFSFFFFVIFLDVQQFYVLYFTNKRISIECKIEEL